MFEERLVRAIRMRKCLYEKTNSDYNNCKLKENAWDEVSESLGIPLNKCKARWKSLRERYVREVKRNRRLRCPEDTSSWHLFPEMTFLKDFICPRTRDNPSFSLVARHNGALALGPLLQRRRTIPEERRDAQYLSNLMEIMSDSSGVDEQETSQNSPVQTPNITAAFMKPRGLDEVPTRTNGEDLSSSQPREAAQQIPPHEINIQPAPIHPANAGFFLMLDKMLKRLPPEDVVDFQMDILNFVHQKATEQRPKREIIYASDE
ncbi:uncharacterized protein LOC132262078 [Phlebotomus argentipes]|uniref:uncharacterized protein LOC132262078 n=1 Tax=Phlebotomus argentipes TaxID=94469 RepID=UPI002892FC52|nr:uncharacterized protein LOC132262078 [Phlebotomus argentipes]